MSDRPRRIIKIDLRTLDRMTPKRLANLEELARIANTQDTDLDLAPDLPQQQFTRDIKSETEVLEEAAEILSNDNSTPLPETDFPGSESAGDQDNTAESKLAALRIKFLTLAEATGVSVTAKVIYDIIFKS